MFPSIQLLPGAIAEMFASVSETGILTIADRYGLMAASFDESLNKKERLESVCKVIFELLCRGTASSKLLHHLQI
ncbi:MAG: hypothetical protein F6K10_06880 [Moorea sp. SIO2B7]|nr:hypothetical protein [Moorena sp. SIO2B7]